jgi:hypothetical protein
MFGWLKRKLRPTPSPQHSFATGTKITDNLATGVRSYVITEDIPMKFRKAKDLDPGFTALIQSFCIAHLAIRSCSLFDVMYPPSTDLNILIIFDVDDAAQCTHFSAELLFLIQNRPEKPRTLISFSKTFKLKRGDLPEAEFYRRPTP